MEVHDEPVERAEAGQRVALNLAGLDRDEVARGDVIVAPPARGAARAAERRRGGGDARRGHARPSGGVPAATYRVDVAITWATPDARPDGGARIAVHHGTRESAAKLVELGGRFFQLRLESPIVPAAGDRLVIRSLAPPDTLGGGVVLDPAPRRHGPSRDLLARLARLERGEPEPEAEPVAPGRGARAGPARPARAGARGGAARRRATNRRSDSEPELLAALREHGRVGAARAEDAHPRRRARRGP